MLIDVKYSPGTQKSPQQTKITQPCFTDTDQVHFPNGRLTTLPPSSPVTNLYGSVSMIGATRACHAIKFSGTNVGTCHLYGAHNRLYARKNGALFNITPIASGSTALTNNPYYTGYDNAQTTPFGTTSGSKMVRFLTFMTGFIRVGDRVTISGVSGAVNGIPDTELNGTHSVISFDGIYPQFLVTTAANATGFPSVASVVIATKLVAVSHTAHGKVDGDRVKISGASGTVGGIPASEINKEHIVARGDADFYAIPTSTAPTSYATGGGASVLEFGTIAAGNLDQTIATGFGAGIYSAGLYSQGGAAVNAQEFPRIWSFANFGNEVVMCPGDYETGDGQKIYIWDGDMAVAPTVLTNAPTDCNWVTVINNSVVALCGRTVKISEIGDGTVWSGITYYEKTLERVWKLVSAFQFTEKDAVIYTPSDAILLRYVGGGELWDISDLYPDDGILSPYSATLLNGVMYWRGARGCYSYDGSPVKKEINDQNEQWIIENTNMGKVWKSFACADIQNGEWYHYFPTGADTEPGDYAIHNPVGHVTLGREPRTAAQRPGFVDSQYHMVNGTSASVAGTIYRHFLSGTSSAAWYAVTSLAYAGGGENRYLVDKFLPDSTQSGDIKLNIITREYAQGQETVTADYTVAPDTEYLTTKAAGKLIGLKFSGNTDAAIGAWKMNVTKLGKR